MKSEFTKMNSRNEDIREINDNSGTIDKDSNRSHFSQISDGSLRALTIAIAANERKITARVIEHISEVDRRKLFLKWGYPSLFEYLVKELKYSESAAYRRIQAARTLQKVPNVSAALQTGELNLTQISKLQTTIKQSEKISGVKIQIAEQQEILNELVGKNGRETEQILDRKFVNLSQQTVTDSCFEKHLGDGSVELTFKISKEVYEDLIRVRELYSHKNPSAKWADILKMMLADVIQKRDQRPKSQSTSLSNANLKVETKTKSETTSDVNSEKTSTHGNTATEVIRESSHFYRAPKRKAIPSRIKRMVIQKSQGKCVFKSSDGKVCGSTFLLEIDHVKPVSYGGTNEPENLRALCRSHNQFVYDSER